MSAVWRWRPLVPHSRGDEERVGFRERLRVVGAGLVLLACDAFSVVLCGDAAAAPSPEGQVTEFSAGLPASNGLDLVDIAAGSDGNLWFADPGPRAAVGRIIPGGLPGRRRSVALVLG